METIRTLRELSCADDYDPDSLPVDRARALIRQFLTPVTAVERVHIRARSTACSPRTSSRRSTCRATTTRRWTAGRCASPTSPADRKRRCAASANRSPASRSTAQLRAGETVRIFTGAVMPSGADTVVMQERATRDADGCRDRRRCRHQGRPEPALRRRGPEARRGRLSRRTAGASRRARHARVARHRRSERLSPAARRVLLDRRRVALDRPAARDRRDLRQQPLHAVRHAEAAGLRDRRHGRRADVPDVLERAFARRSGHRGRRHHVRRRVGRRGRFRQGAARQARRGAVLEDRDEAGPSARLRHASAARISSACRAIRCR